LQISANEILEKNHAPSRKIPTKLSLAAVNNEINKNKYLKLTQAQLWGTLTIQIINFCAEIKQNGKFSSILAGSCP